MAESELAMANEVRTGPHEVALERALETSRPRLVRLCAQLTGSADAAEDLAQETLTEAWRNRWKLYDPRGCDRWMSAIARNVCHRWRRSHAADQCRVRSLAMPEAEDGLPDEFDLEAELDRGEVASLLDRALALLPPDLRWVLIQHYIHEEPPSEIAQRLGLSNEALGQRLHRGRRAMRRVLSMDLRIDAAAYGLLDSGADWQETRLWCPACATRKLTCRLERDGGILAFRCPQCCGDPDQPMFETRHAGILCGVKGYRSMFNRQRRWVGEEVQRALCDPDTCPRCGRSGRLSLIHPPEPLHPLRPSHGISVCCSACGMHTSATLEGLALGLPAVQRFWREHTRVCALPEQPCNVADGPGAITAFESRDRTARLDVLWSLDGYRLVDAIAT